MGMSASFVVLKVTGEMDELEALEDEGGEGDWIEALGDDWKVEYYFGSSLYGARLTLLPRLEVETASPTMIGYLFDSDVIECLAYSKRGSVSFEIGATEVAESGLEPSDGCLVADPVPGLCVWAEDADLSPNVDSIRSALNDTDTPVESVLEELLVALGIPRS